MLGSETQKNMQAASFSKKILGHYPEFVKALFLVKKAAALTNRETGAIEEAHAARLISVIDDINQRLLNMPHHERNECFAVDVFAGGGSIGIHLNISEYLMLASGVPLHIINKSQSTADVCHTAFRIAIIRSWKRLAVVLDKVVEELTSKSIQFHHVQTLGRTCLQDASSISVGNSLSATPAALERRKRQAEGLIGSLHELALGGTVMGNGNGACAFYQEKILHNLARVSDLPIIARKNRYEAAQYSDDVGAIVSELSHIALIMMKLARDVRLLSSGPQGGFGELSIPKVHEGSSFYKDKNNPIVPETVLQCGFLVLGAHHATQCALLHAELQLNIFDNAVCINALDCMEWLTQSLTLFESHCIRGIAVNSERCRDLAQRTTATKL